MPGDSNSQYSGLDRRDLLRAAGAGSASLAMMLTAGCTGSRKTTPAGSGGDGGDGSSDGDGSSSSDGGDGGGDSTEEPSDSGGPKTGGRLRIGLAEALHPFDQRTSPGMPLFTNDVFGTLLTRDPDGNIGPHLATDWTFENGGTEMVMPLREGVTFHDGSPFDAEYVKWFLEDYLMNGAGTSYMVEKLDEAVVEDAHRVRLKFNKPSPNILWNLAGSWGSLHSREMVEEHGDSYGTGTNVASTGPFELVEKESDSRVILERNGDWEWPRPWVTEIADVSDPRPATVEYQVFPEQATRTSAFESRDLDGLMMAVPFERIPRYKQSNEQTYETPSVTMSQVFTWFNLDPEKSPSPILAEDLALRKGISYAVDREAIVQGVYNGSGEPAPNYLVPAVGAHDVPEEYNYRFDLERARTVMEESGWNVEPGGVSTKDDARAEFELNPWNDSHTRKRATILKEQLEEIGVKVNVVPLDSATLRERGKSGDFAAAMYTFYEWSNADLLWWLNSSDVVDSYFASSRAGVQFPEVDELLTTASNAQTWEKRTEEYKEVHKHLLENVVPTLYEAYVYRGDVHWNHVHDWEANYTGKPSEVIWSENW